MLITVPTTATTLYAILDSDQRLDTDEQGRKNTDRGVLLRNTWANTVYIETYGDTVDSTTGYPLATDEEISLGISNFNEIHLVALWGTSDMIALIN